MPLFPDVPAWMKSGALLVLLTIAAVPFAHAQTPPPQSWREALARLRGARQGIPAARLATRWTEVAESEPNNSAATADSVAFGDRATGVLNPAGDVDAWVIALEAGQFVSFDVDAQSLGSPLDSKLALFAPDGTTQLAFNDDFDGFDSRISYHVTTSGRYFVLIGAFGQAGGPELAYAIRFSAVTCNPVGTEVEPNDTPVTATPVVIGASVTGEICSPDGAAADADYWAFAAQAGTAVELDVDAALPAGLTVNPALVLYAPDGTTVLSANDDADGFDPRLQFAFATAGTYYARVTGLGQPGDNPFPYSLHVRAITPGPGDPITVTADALGFPFGIAVGKTGDLFVGELASDRIRRISPNGIVTTFVSGIPSPLGLAFDAADNLLVVSVDATVYRVTPAGVATPFIEGLPFPFWIAVAPDGRIWVTDIADGSLRRYSPSGQFETRISVASAGGFGPGAVALGPSGEPYFSTGTEIWRVRGGALERVLANGVVNWAFAFDASGNMYIPQPTAGRVILVDSAGIELANPFAVSTQGPQAVAFGRDATGATTARLFVTDPLAGRVHELNPAGVARPGLPVGYVVPPFSAEVAAAALLGGAALSAEARQYLDAVGNHNGRYDVGDLQAYLRTLHRLTGATTLARPGSAR